MILFGIKNCDTVKKARQWLDANGVDYQFHDFRKDGLTEKQINAWLEHLSWEALINKRSTTWRQLNDKQKDPLTQQKAVKLMLEQPTLIKRPVILTGNDCFVGFSIDC